MYSRVHLKDGSVVDSITSEITESEKEKFRHVISDVMRDRAWQVSFETADGWACFPGHAIMYLEMRDSTLDRQNRDALE